MSCCWTSQDSNTVSRCFRWWFGKWCNALAAVPIPLSLSISDNGPHRQREATPSLLLPSLLHTFSLSARLSFYLSVSSNGAQQSKEDPVCCASPAGTDWPTGCWTCEFLCMFSDVCWGSRGFIHMKRWMKLLHTESCLEFCVWVQSSK